MTVTNPGVLAHIASQTKDNLEFLISEGQVAHDDCRLLLDKLKAIEGLAPPSSQAGDFKSALTTFPPANKQVVFRARAIWGYNEHDQDPKDLSFSTDDIIDILNETNEDWWEGRCNGRVGLFPSNHVEKVASHGFPAPSTHAPPALTGEKFTSHIPTPNYQPQYITPSPGPAYTPSPHSGQTPHVTNTAQATVVIHEQPKTSKPKRHLFHGGFGSSLAQSAVGGVGFGAGSAIGNGLVKAIF